MGFKQRLTTDQIRTVINLSAKRNVAEARTAAASRQLRSSSQRSFGCAPCRLPALQKEPSVWHHQNSVESRGLFEVSGSLG